MVHVHQSSWVTKCTVNELQYFERNFFSQAVAFNSGLQIFRKPCCKQMCHYPGFVVPLIEYRLSRFNIILKSPKIL